MSKNTGILAVIAAAVVVIAGVMVYKATEKSPEEKMAESISGAIESVSEAAKAE